MCDARYNYLIVYTIEKDENNERDQFVQAIREKYNINDNDIDQSTIGIQTADSPQEISRFLKTTILSINENIVATVRFFCSGNMVNRNDLNDKLLQYTVINNRTM